MSLRNQDWRKVVKALGKLGFVVKRQSGSHVIMEHADGRWTVVPRHDPIKAGTMKSIVDDVGISEEEFLELL
ncbi:MAG: type II toxin-antitoxin system HicA family toxin [Nitrososphaerota archaeon]|nr:type II toxin-antitoxin system HicA family toxin [Nitrososphaerota archaeon]MDG7025388.1 type II toxin-antitoxin system HicA family toxin [Nitrososphaerota archaeon]